MAAEGKRCPWQELLALTHGALTELRVEELEKLAARAQEMLDAHAAFKPGNMPGRPGIEARSLRREHGQLGKFLRATEENLAVLRAVRGKGANTSGGFRWVR